MLKVKIIVIFRKIKKYQKSSDLLIFRILFQRIVQKINHNITIN